MILELTTEKIFQIILCFIMIFAMGMKYDVSHEAREFANKIWMTSLVLVWIIVFLS